MALILSTGLRNTLIGGTNSFKQTFANGVLRIYDGAIPSSPDGVATGNLLCSFTGVNFNSGTAGSTGLAAVVTGIVAQSGTAGYFRLSPNGDDPGTAGTSVSRVDGKIGLMLDSNADYIMPSLSLIAGQSLSIPQANFGLPATTT